MVRRALTASVHQRGHTRTAATALPLTSRSILFATAAFAFAYPACTRALGTEGVDAREGLLGTSAGVSHGPDVHTHASAHMAKHYQHQSLRLRERCRSFVAMERHSLGCGNATSCHRSLNDHVLIACRWNSVSNYLSRVLPNDRADTGG